MGFITHIISFWDDLFKNCFTLPSMSNHLNINWSDAINKTAKGINDYDLGKVLEISEDYVVTERGSPDKDTFVLPKIISSEFDGSTLRFNLSKEDSNKYKQ